MLADELYSMIHVPRLKDENAAELFFGFGIGAVGPGGSQRRSFALARSSRGHDGAYSEVAAARLFRCSLRVRVEKKLAHLARRIA
jgi:hypothetical protein